MQLLVTGRKPTHRQPLQLNADRPYTSAEILSSGSSQTAEQLVQDHPA